MGQEAPNTNVENAETVNVEAPAPEGNDQPAEGNEGTGSDATPEPAEQETGITTDDAE